MMPEMTSTLPEVLSTLALDQVNQNLFVGAQLDGPAHHILGGHIGAQALLAAVQTVPAERTARSLHAQFLRSGDARTPVEFEVSVLHDGGTFSTRRTTARQQGDVLMESTVSFSRAAPQDPAHQPTMPVVPQPDSLSTTDRAGVWSSLDWFERREVPGGPGVRLWWRPDGDVPADPVLARVLVAYLSAVTMVEAALVTRRSAEPVTIAPMLDHSVWWHDTADLTDWLFYEHDCPSGAHRRALTTGRMFNRDGVLVCSTAQEVYFPPAR
jgi:acyl-CoA thioesterase II